MNRLRWAAHGMRSTHKESRGVAPAHREAAGLDALRQGCGLAVRALWVRRKCSSAPRAPRPQTCMFMMSV